MDSTVLIDSLLIYRSRTLNNPNDNNIIEMDSNRFLHEKREALDAIELLKLFAKHKGISIDIAHDDGDVPNEFFQSESPNNYERDNNSESTNSVCSPSPHKHPIDTQLDPTTKTPAPPPVNENLQEQSNPVAIEIITKSPTLSKHLHHQQQLNQQQEQIQRQQQQHDIKPFIEQNATINMKKTTSDI